MRTRHIHRTRIVPVITIILPAVCFLLAGWGVIWLLEGDTLSSRAGETGAIAAARSVTRQHVPGQPRAAPTRSALAAMSQPIAPSPEAPGRVGRSPTPTAPNAPTAPVVRPSPTAEPEGGREPPEKVLLELVPQGKQERNLSCELQSASDLAWYYGRPYTWEEVFERVGHDPGGNPHKGFVGLSLDDTPGYVYPRGYGVYAEPIARALQELGLSAEVHYRESSEWVKGQMARGRPVMVWATGGMVVRSAEEWLAEDGTRVTGVRGEHTFLVVGYDEGGVWVVDPWVGARRYFDWEVFLTSWEILDRMSVVVTEDKEMPVVD